VVGFAALASVRWFAAACEVLHRLRLTHDRPDFRIPSVQTGGGEVRVRERVLLQMPFGRLLRFEKTTAPGGPEVLVVAPMSGHFATLLRETVRTLLADHDVHITDWANARDVPLACPLTRKRMETHGSD
jgi:poly(3-hydroxybutyrate) depolymerase